MRRVLIEALEVNMVKILIMLTLGAFCSIIYPSPSLFAATEREIICGKLNAEGANIGIVGPFDYTNPAYKDNQLFQVESAHFTPDVERLIKGNTSFGPNGDLNYTLLAFPNHHRALFSLINLSVREKSDKLRDMNYSVECYFDRAIRFKPKDAIVKMLYGIYLMKIKKYDDALAQFKIAENDLQNYAEFHYNIGLLYFEKQDWQKSADHAAKAYKLGYPLPGLKNKLIKAGKWRLVFQPLPAENR